MGATSSVGVILRDPEGLANTEVVADKSRVALAKVTFGTEYIARVGSRAHCRTVMCKRSKSHSRPRPPFHIRGLFATSISVAARTRQNEEARRRRKGKGKRGRALETDLRTSYAVESNWHGNLNPIAPVSNWCTVWHRARSSLAGKLSALYRSGRHMRCGGKPLSTRRHHGDSSEIEVWLWPGRGDVIATKGQKGHGRSANSLFWTAG